MAINYKSSMTKAELLKIATRNGVAADDSMTKTAILAVLGGVEDNDAPPEKSAARGPQAVQDDTGNAGAGSGTTDTAGHRTPAEDTQEASEGYDLFVYAGPTLPRGRLKENAVFCGTFGDVKAYLADVLEEYPQVARLIVPVNRLAAFSVRVKTPGNLAHKYYNDIVSIMHGNREV